MSKIHVVPPADYSGVHEAAKIQFEKFLTTLNTDVYITSALRPGDPGQHGQGLAIDVVAPALHLLDFYLLAEKSNQFTGLGVYPTWHYAGNTVGGLHLDLRLGKNARWMGLGNDRNQKYIALTTENLKASGVV